MDQSNPRKGNNRSFERLIAIVNEVPKLVDVNVRFEDWHMYKEPVINAHEGGQTLKEAVTINDLAEFLAGGRIFANGVMVVDRLKVAATVVFSADSSGAVRIESTQMGQVEQLSVDDSSARELAADTLGGLDPAPYFRLMASIIESALHLIAEKPKHSILELRGLGKQIWEGIDAQEYVDRERDAWVG